MRRILVAVSLIGILVGAAFWLLWDEKADASLPPLKNPRLVVKKNKRRLQVFDNDKLVKTYKIVLGFEPKGDKIKRDDGKTPEGEYFVAVKNPDSKFHRSLGLNYPNIKDAKRGLQMNLISQSEYDEIILANQEKRLPPQNTALGSEIYIHGGGINRDWTAGCIALDDDQMQELFDALPAANVSVTIEP
jgi:murein L,D-transpeptidase YafK